MTECCYHNGLNWIKLEDSSAIDKAPVFVGDRMIMPGDVVSRLGEKNRSAFIPDGPVRFIGKFENALLFQFVVDGDKYPWYVALHYIDPGCLLNVNPFKGCGSDIRIVKLEVQS